MLINVPEPLITLQLLEDSDLPTYINAITTQKKLYANPTALNAQGQPPEMFLQGNAYDLNDVEELDYRTARVASGEKLVEYEYQAWRWFFDLEAYAVSFQFQADSVLWSALLTRTSFGSC
ncbi:hypothetical protein D5R40_08170 [Okeania hirsuta]|uniref:Uncharacterized protein n=1 Tax=Okeania hirsuta TaxID=1458930 RepID=A0A3N6PGJ5_9CYAN|nr:hypothetical protein [Okeania sp. SIO2B9]RQH26110.1 hypothetical protein D4Z78_00830 [Okeania hirsuta]RQH48213.1 hypothetical protein D5R40_08170 [Okeania hirsuta]